MWLNTARERDLGPRKAECGTGMLPSHASSGVILPRSRANDLSCRSSLSSPLAHYGSSDIVSREEGLAHVAML